MNNDIPTAELSAGARTFFTTDHRACDQLWAKFEAAMEAKDPQAAELRSVFSHRLRRHLSMEEEVLFPAFEAITGSSGGPVMVMKMEHEQMRAVLDSMDLCAKEQDLEAVLDEGDTLHLLIQQHNAKEEGILYPMIDQVLTASWPEISARLQPYLR